VPLSPPRSNTRDPSPRRNMRSCDTKIVMPHENQGAFKIRQGVHYISLVAGCPTHRARCAVWVLTPPKCVQFDNTVVAIRLLFLPCPLLTLHHHFSQDQVDSRLVARAFGFEPIHNLYIHPQRDSPFARTVPARLPACLLLGQGQQFLFNRGPHPAQFPRT
jgi:hypothetical protein